MLLALADVLTDTLSSEEQRAGGSSRGRTDGELPQTCPGGAITVCPSSHLDRALVVICSRGLSALSHQSPKALELNKEGLDWDRIAERVGAIRWFLTSPYRV